MTFKLAIANLKGGVGKSTASLFLAETLAVYHGLRILVVDLDPQANASYMLLSREGLEYAEASGKTLTNLVLDLISKEAQLSPTGYIYPNASDLSELRETGGRGKVDVLPSVPRMWFVEVVRERQSYVENTDPADELRKCLGSYLEPLEVWYDVMIFDCPPGFSALTRAGLVSADAIVSPTIADAVSIRSLSDFVSIGLGDVLKVRGIIKHHVIISKYRASTEQMREVELLKKSYDVLSPYVKESVAMTRATERIRADSIRSYGNKYGALQGDLRKLTDSIYRNVIKIGRG